MTKPEAIAAMNAGQKVTHKFFEDNEWVTIINNQIVSEDGITHERFWSYRTSKEWDTGWSIYEN